MSYYLRAFCLKGKVLETGKLREHLLSKGIEVHIPADLQEREESRVTDFEYASGKTPIMVEVNSPENSGGFFESEIKEFIEEISPLGLSLKKHVVYRNLKDTKFTVAIRLPADIDERGFTVSDAIIEYCIKNFKAMIQADGEGFYQKKKLILPLK